MQEEKRSGGGGVTRLFGGVAVPTRKGPRRVVNEGEKDVQKRVFGGTVVPGGSGWINVDIGGWVGRDVVRSRVWDEVKTGSVNSGRLEETVNDRRVIDRDVSRTSLSTVVPSPKTDKTSEHIDTVYHPQVIHKHFLITYLIT